MLVMRCGVGVASRDSGIRSRTVELHGGFEQRLSVGRKTSCGVQDPHPRAIAQVVAPRGFLVGEAGKPAQMTPIGAGRVRVVLTGPGLDTSVEAARTSACATSRDTLPNLGKRVLSE
jgi:hypothetical protein